jgi:hypothetical protein
MVGLAELATGVEATGRIYRFLRATGVVPWFARKVLEIQSGAIVHAGVRFYPDRSALKRVEPSLEELIRSAPAIDAILVGGQEFIGAGTELHRLRRAVLPHPDCASLKEYASTVDSGLPSQISHNSGQLRDAGVQVRWSRQFFCHTVLIGREGCERGDAEDKANILWVQVESVLPYLNRDHRTGFKLTKKRYPTHVEQLRTFFAKLWKDSTAINAD